MYLLRRAGFAALWGLVFGLGLAIVDCARITISLQGGSPLTPYLIDCLPVFNRASLKWMLFTGILAGGIGAVSHLLSLFKRKGSGLSPGLLQDAPKCALVLILVYGFLAFHHHPKVLSVTLSRTAVYILLFLSGALLTWLVLKVLVAFSFPGRRIVLSALALLFLSLIIMIFGFELRMTGYLRLPGFGKNAEASSPNILLVVLDTVRADRMSCYGYGRPVTPTIDRIASEGVLFKKCVSDSIWTIPSHASIFTGLYPTTHQVGYKNFSLSREFVTLAEALKDKGYQTAGFVANPVLSSRNHFSQGFDYYKSYGNSRIDHTAFNLLGNVVWNRIGLLTMPPPKRYPPHFPFQKGKRLVDDVNNWFRIEYRNKKPFFLFLNFMDAHFPYQPSEPFKSAFSTLDDDTTFYTRTVKSQGYFRAGYTVSDEDIRKMDELYTASISYIDSSISELVAGLRETDLFEDAAIIITSDHGEYFGEHSPFYLRLFHNFGIFNELLSVPLIIRYPRLIDSGQVVEGQVQNVDIMPTLLHFAGIDSLACPYQIQGKDLLTLAEEGGREYTFSVFIAPPAQRFLRKGQIKRVLATYPGVRFDDWFKDYTALQNGQFKFVKDSLGKKALFDLTVDAGELEEVTEIYPEVAEKMEELLEQFEERLTDTAIQSLPAVTDPETIRNLREMGYIQ